MRRCNLLCVFATLAALVCAGAAPSLALSVGKPPVDPPSWWNQECAYYAYGWWENLELTSTTGAKSPADDPAHFASNYLDNTDFTAYVGANNCVHVYLENSERPDYYKEVFIRVQGYQTADGRPERIELATDGQTFKGTKVGGRLDEYQKWWLVVDGIIDHQPEYVHLWFTVPTLTKVTSIWAGENCLPKPVPEPGTGLLLGSGLTCLLAVRRRRPVAHGPSRSGRLQRVGANGPALP